MLKTNRQNYAKRLRRLNRLMDAADSGANCADKIRTLTKSIWRFENKHYPLACKRCRVIPALRRQYAIDTDLRYARRGNHHLRRQHTQIRRLLCIFNKTPMIKNWPDVAKDKLAKAFLAYLEK